MSFRFESEIYYSTVATTTSTNSVLIGPVCVRNLEGFSIIYQNNHTAIAFLDLQVQACHDPSGTAANVPPNWVQIPTATLPQPSALGATASVLTARINNGWDFIRVVGITSATASAGTLRISVGGFQSR